MQSSDSLSESFFTWVQPNAYHTRPPDEGINVYSFARPEEYHNSRKLYLNITNIKPDNISNENICAICLDTLNIQNSVVLNCCHQFCEECINKLLHNHNTLKEPTCPLCRTEITELYFENKHIQNTIINTEYKCISVVDVDDID
jgi:hypothetical protein